jgi:hydroxyacylglutathione hydrolase
MTARLHVFRDNDVLIAGLPVGPFQMNQYLVACPQTREAAIIDAGAPPAPFIRFAEERGLRITQILQTHGHIDHVAGLASTVATLKIPISLHHLDRQIYDAAPMVGKMYGFPCDPPPPPDFDLAELATVAIGALQLDVIHTPGHSPGHVIFWCRDRAFCIGGDLLFAGSIGRTDLPGSNPEDMEQSLRQILELPDATDVYAGHMAPTSIGRERRVNPFLRELIEQ